MGKYRVVAGQNIYDVAQTLLGLQSKTNNAIQRRNTVEIESA